MNPTIAQCEKCGSVLVPGTNFCRQCGAAIISDNSRSSMELPTTRFPQQREVGSTQQHDSRPTIPNAGLSMPAAAPADVNISSGSPKPKSGRAYPVVLLAIAVLVILVCSAVAIVRMNGHSRTTSNAALLYPGAQTVLDITDQDGGRAIQLQTTDSLEEVESWYQKNLKPTKTVKLASTSIVLRNENTMVTIASEGGKTNILIKISD